MSEPKIFVLNVGNGDPTIYECPYWDLLPPLTPEEHSKLSVSVRTDGIKTPLTVLILGEDRYRVLDGYHRLTVAEELHLTPDEVPLHQIGDDTDFEPDDEERLAYSLNEARRQLSAEQLAQLRENRRSRVVASRSEGKSLRTIAAEEGVSLGQVQRDLATVSPDTVELPKVVKGVDGREYDREKLPKKEEKQPSLLIATGSEAGGRVQSVFEEAEARAEAKKPRLCQWPRGCELPAVRPYAYCDPHQEAMEAEEEGAAPELPLPPPAPRVEPPKLSAPKCLRDDCTRKTWHSSGYCEEHEPPTPTMQLLDTAAKGLLDQVAKLGASEQAAAEGAEPDGSAPKEESYQHWNTPRWLIDLISQLRPVALDPCSNKHSVVQARLIRTVSDDGLAADFCWWIEAQRHRGLVYVNPPYNNPLPWAERAIAEAAAGAEIVLCLPSSHSTLWWRRLKDHCQALALMGSRVQFGREGVFNGGSRHETTLFYFGRWAADFTRIFESLDEIGEPFALVVPRKPYSPAAVPDPRQPGLPFPEAPGGSVPVVPAVRTEEEPNDWLARATKAFATLHTTEETTALYEQLSAKATTDAEKAALLEAYEVWRQRYPHAENGRSPRPPEKGTVQVEAFIKADGLSSIRYGIHYLDTSPRRFALHPKALEGMRGDKRLVVRTLTWLEDGLKALQACGDKAAGLVIFDGLMDQAAGSEIATRDQIRQVWNDWQTARYEASQAPKKGPQCKHKQGSKQCRNSAVAPSKFCISHLKKVEGKKGQVGR